MKETKYCQRLRTLALLLILHASLFALHSYAQTEPEYRAEIGAGLGTMGYLGDLNGNLLKNLQPMGSLVARYKMNLPSFVYREKMKAGLTGYAQIEGRYNTSAEDKLMLDMMYIESFSIWLDVKLILRTVTIFLKKDSTQGFQKSPGSNIKVKRGDIRS